MSHPISYEDILDVIFQVDLIMKLNYMPEILGISIDVSISKELSILLKKIFESAK